jgi:hypothetical protein
MQHVDMIKTGFLQDQKSWIFMPEYVEFFISEDGNNFQSIGRENNLIDARQGGGVVHDFSILARNKEIRYIRVYAKNRAICPEWHPGAGNPAWLFIDEVVIE